MRIGSVAVGAARPSGGSDEGLYGLLARAGAQTARVLRPAGAGGLVVFVLGKTFEITSPQAFPAGSLLRLTADPARPNQVLIEPLPAAPASAQVDVGGVDALLAALGQPAGAVQRTLVRALLGLGLPVGADSLAALAQLLPNLSPQQLPALQLLLAQGLPISQAILNLVENWLAAAGASAPLAELWAQLRGGSPLAPLSKGGGGDWAEWILRLSGSDARDTAALAGRLASLFRPFAQPTEARPAPADLPNLVASALADAGASPEGRALLAQLRLAELLSAQSGAGGMLLFPLFMDFDGESTMAWARLEREPEGEEGRREKPATRLTLALSLSRLGALQVDFLLADPHLSLWFFFADETAAEAARHQLPALRKALAAHGLVPGEMEAVRAAAVAHQLLLETLRALAGAPHPPRLELRA